MDILNILTLIISTIWGFRGYMIAFVMFCLGIRFKSSKHLTYLYTFYYWIIIGLNTISADYISYQEMYEFCNAPRYAEHEIGYMALCKLFYSLGFTFAQFRMVIGAVIAILLVKGISKYTKKVNFVLSVMLLFPGPSLVSGIRNAISMVIIINGLYYLLNGTDYKMKDNFRLKILNVAGKFYNSKKAETKKTIIYIVFVLIATLFHYASLFYLIFIYAKYSKSKLSYLVIQTFTLIVVVIGVYQTGIIYSLISSITSREKTLQWFVQTDSNQVYISVLYYISLFLFAILLGFLYESRKIILYRERNLMGRNDILNYNNVLVISRIVIVSFMAFAGAIFKSVVFLRLVLTPIPVTFCIFAESLTTYGKDDIMIQQKAVRLRLLLYPFVAFVSLFVYGYWIGGEMLKSFVNNMIFQ